MTDWEALGLPAGTLDRREIRRAYAASLRRHTPEDDPEGFRRVRAAYESLLRRVERGHPSPEFAANDDAEDTEAPEDEEEEAPAAAAAPPPPGAPEARAPVADGEADAVATRRPSDPEASARPASGPHEVPVPAATDVPCAAGDRPDAVARPVESEAAPSRAQGFVGPFARLESAWALPPSASRDVRLVQAIAGCTQDLLAGRVDAEAWHHAVLGSCGDRPDLLHAALSNADLVAFAVRGWVAPCGIVADFCARTGAWERLGDLAKDLLASSGRLTGASSSAEFLAGLASLLGVYDARASARIGDLAYRVATVSGRHALDLHAADAMHRMGLEVAYASPAARGVLASIVLHERWDGDLKRPGTAAAMRAVGRLDKGTVGYEWFSRHVPRFLSLGRSSVESRVAARAPPHDPASGGFPFVAVGALIAVFLGLGRCNRDERASDLLDRQRQEYDRDLGERLRRLRERWPSDRRAPDVPPEAAPPKPR